MFAEPFFNIGVAFTLPVFANSYMNLKKFLPDVNKYGIALIGINIILFILYLSLRDFYFFALVQIVSILLITYYWFTGLFIFKKCIYARIFKLAYFLITFSTYGYYLAKTFGIESLDIKFKPI